MGIKIPTKYSKDEALAIANKGAQDSSLSLSERRKYEDTYNELVSRYAKGGEVKKMAKKPIVEYGGKEKYASKAAMMKHEKGESKAVEKKEKMAKGGSVKGVTALAKGGVAKKKKC